jgi:hypothetical protein
MVQPQLLFEKLSVLFEKLSWCIFGCQHSLLQLCNKLMLKYNNFSTLPVMNKNTPPINRWKEYHQSLEADDAKKYRRQIEQLLSIGPAAFNRKINNPQPLSYAEKQLIGRVYRVKKEYLFPELGAQLSGR